jgi:hypothetical protein
MLLHSVKHVSPSWSFLRLIVYLNVFLELLLETFYIYLAARAAASIHVAAGDKKFVSAYKPFSNFVNFVTMIKNL